MRPTTENDAALQGPSQYEQFRRPCISENRAVLGMMWWLPADAALMALTAGTPYACGAVRLEPSIPAVSGAVRYPMWTWEAPTGPVQLALALHGSSYGGEI